MHGMDAADRVDVSGLKTPRFPAQCSAASVVNYSCQGLSSQWSSLSDHWEFTCHAFA